MSEVKAQLETAIAAHQAGRLDEAESGYRRVLESDSGLAEAHFMLGLAQLQRARPEEVRKCLAQALAIDPGKLLLGGRSMPLDRHGQDVLRYRGPSGTHKAFSAAAVLQSEIRILNGEKPTIKDQTAFKDKFVLFGL